MDLSLPMTVDQVFNDFRGRRAGIIRALTTDVVQFYRQCDPKRENMCLYGLPNETWKVRPPVKEVPPDIPEPALGINFARDRMQDKDWLSLVAAQSDAWLLSVAFYFGARIWLGKNERKRLFGLINDLPSLYEIVSGKHELPKVQPGAQISQNSKSNGETSRSGHSDPKR